MFGFFKKEKSVKEEIKESEDVLFIKSLAKTVNLDVLIMEYKKAVETNKQFKEILERKQFEKVINYIKPLIETHLKNGVDRFNTEELAYKDYPYSVPYNLASLFCKHTGIAITQNNKFTDWKIDENGRYQEMCLSPEEAKAYLYIQIDIKEKK